MSERIRYDSHMDAPSKLQDKETLRVIAANMRRLRQGITLAEVARRAGTYPMNVQRIEHEVSMPGAGLLLRVAQALGTTPDRLLDAHAAESQSKKRCGRS